MFYITHDLRPVLRCAICGQQIPRAGDASVVFPRRMASGNPEPVTITHSDYCRVRAQENMDTGSGPGLTMPLVEYSDKLTTPG